MAQDDFQNIVKLRGIVDEPPAPSHTTFGEQFFTFKLRVPRISGYVDCLPVTLSERLVFKRCPSTGDVVTLIGQLRSYNQYREGASHLVLTVFVKDIIFADTGEGYSNYIAIKGRLCKPPVYRKTPFGREITDLLLAVNRAYQKSDYIPCIAWGQTARRLSCCSVGEHIFLTGRIQSRMYEKRLCDGTAVSKTAYEVSAASAEFEKGSLL